MSRARYRWSSDVLGVRVGSERCSCRRSIRFSVRSEAVGNGHGHGGQVGVVVNCVGSVGTGMNGKAPRQPPRGPPLEFGRLFVGMVHGY